MHANVSSNSCIVRVVATYTYYLGSSGKDVENRFFIACEPRAFHLDQGENIVPKEQNFRTDVNVMILLRSRLVLVAYTHVPVSLRGLKPWSCGFCHRITWVEPEE